MDTVVWVAFITAAATLLSPLIPKWWSAREDEKKLKREKEQARRNAYKKFIQIYSTHYSSDHGVDPYLNAALNVAEFEDLILPQPIKMESHGGIIEISSLKDLVTALTRLKTRIGYDPGYDVDEDDFDHYDNFGEKIDKLRMKVSLEFSPKLIEILSRMP